MRCEFKRRDLIAKIGEPVIWLVTSAKYDYYEMQEVDAQGKFYDGWYGRPKEEVDEKYVKVGTWKDKMPFEVSFVLDLPIEVDA